MSFVDEAVDAGVRLRNVSGSAEKRHIIETAGAGACFLDYDRDGDLDLYMVNGATVDTAGKPDAPHDVLYRNEGGGRFSDVSAEAGLDSERGWGGGCAVGDYDNDSDPDLFVTNIGPNLLWRNEGNGRFTNVADAAGVAGAGWSLGAAFLDIEGDGDLDLYVARYLHVSVADVQSPPQGCSWKGIPVMCGPRGFPGEEDALYRNNGNGTFTEVSGEAGIAGRALFGMGVVAGDLDADGDADVFVANDSQDNQLFLNDGRGRFTESGLTAGVALSGDGRQQASMGAALGDYDNDGDEDLLVTNFSDDYHTLYRNEGGGLFTDVTLAAGIATRASLGWAVGFFDYDNDADLDVFVASGHVYPQVDGRDPATSYRQQNLLFRNNADGTFTNVSNEAGPGLRQVRSSRGAAFGDYDDDGDIDLVVVNENDTPSLLRNDGGNALRWIKVRLVGARSNRDGIGARLRVRTGERTQFREVRLNEGYCSSHDPRVHFGLGDARKVDRLEIEWPSGKTQVLTDLPAGHLVTVHEEKGLTGDVALGDRPVAAPAPAAAMPSEPRRREVPVTSAGRISPASLREIQTLAQTGTQRILAGDYAQGIAALEQALQRLPDRAEAARSADALGVGDPERYRSFLASLYDNLGVGLMRAERLEECAAAFGHAVSLAPQRAKSHHNLGLCHFHARRHGPAIAALRAARSIGGAGPSLAYDLGRALSLAGRCAEAVPELRRGLEALPAVDPEGRRAEAWYQMGTCFAEQGQHEDASAAFRETLFLVPGHQKALYKLGLARRATGQKDAADRVQALFQARQPADEVVRSLKRAGQRTPGERMEVARTFRNAGLPTEAFLEVQKVIAATPGDASALALLGELYLALRPPGLDEATRAFETALKLDPAQPDALAGLGEIHRRQGRAAEAEGLFRQVLAARPAHVGAARGLARLSPNSAGPEQVLHPVDQAGALYGEDVEIRVRALSRSGNKADAEKLIAESPFLGTTARAALRQMVVERPD